MAVFQSLQNKVVFVDFLGFSSAESRIRKVVQRNGAFVRLLQGPIPEPKSVKNISNIFSLTKSPIISLEKLFFLFKRQKLDKCNFYKKFINKQKKY